MKFLSFERFFKTASMEARFVVRRSRKLMAASLALVVIGCAVTWVAVSAYTKNSNAGSTASGAVNVAPTARPAPALRPMGGEITGPIQLVQFAIYDVGIYPQSATVSEGNVGIQIEDFAGGTSGLVIEQVVGNSYTQIDTVVREGNFMRGRLNLRLEGGNYEVYAAERPNIRATLTVEK